MKKKETIVILGGTSVIAQNAAKIWLKRYSVDIILIGRNLKKLNLIASNLNPSNPSSEIVCKELVFDDLEAGQKLVNEIFQFHHITKALIAFGTLPDQSICQKDSKYAKDSLVINGVMPIIYSEMFIEKMNASLASTLGIIGSVAGDRGRKSNYFYGSSKSMIEAYVQGARHRLTSSPLNVCIIKPGPTKTPMTETLNLNLKLADPTIVAMDIVKGMHKNKSVIYTPSKWKIIMTIIKNLPDFIFHKLNI